MSSCGQACVRSGVDRHTVKLVASVMVVFWETLHAIRSRWQTTTPDGSRRRRWVSSYALLFLFTPM